MTVGVALRLLAAMGLWSRCFPLVTIGLGLAPHLAFAAMRAALAGLCLLVLGALIRRPVPSSGRIWGLIVLVALGATTLEFLGMFHAAEFVSPGGNERLGWAQVSGAALILMGVALVQRDAKATTV